MKISEIINEADYSSMGNSKYKTDNNKPVDSGRRNFLRTGAGLAAAAGAGAVGMNMLGGKNQNSQQSKNSPPSEKSEPDQKKAAHFEFDPQFSRNRLMDYIDPEGDLHRRPIPVTDTDQVGTVYISYGAGGPTGYVDTLYIDKGILRAFITNDRDSVIPKIVDININNKMIRYGDGQSGEFRYWNEGSVMNAVASAVFTLGTS
jgi:hypothetical protein